MRGRKNRNLGWLMNEDYEGIGGYSNAYSEGGSYGSTTAPANPGYSNPLVTSELQSFIAANTTAATSYAPPPAPTMPVYAPSPPIEQTSGAVPMTYDYYGGGYTPPAQYVQAPTINPNYGTIDSSTPTLPDYSPPVYDNTGNAPEQVTSTGYIPPPQQVTDNPFDIPNFTPSGDYTGSQFSTPDLPNYGQLTGDGGGGFPSGPRQSGGGASGGGSSGGGGPQPQQKQSPPVQVNVNIPRQSGSGYPGGNRYHRIAGNYGAQSPYGQGGQQSSYGNAGAGYNAPSIIPYLLIGGLGLLAYNMLSGKKEHRT